MAARSTENSSREKAAAKPKLLSGGNPQIPKGDGDAPVEDYIGAMPDWKRDVGRYLDALIVRTVPRVRKAVSTKYIKVTFHRGTAFRPVSPVASKHEHVRYFHIHEDDEVDDKQLASWIRQASKLSGEELL
jgi:hypothetical protein